MYQYGYYWIWAFPSLQPLIQWSMVLQDGPNASACFNEGQNSFFAQNPSQPLGFADAYLTDYLVHSAQQHALVGLLQQFQIHVGGLAGTSTRIDSLDRDLPTLFYRDLDLAIIIDDATYLPYAVRTTENHTVFGPSFSDVVFLSYTSEQVDYNHTIQLPHRIQTVYNSASILEDFVIDDITINPDFPEDFFVAKSTPPSVDSASSVSTDPVLPQTDSEYPRSELHEFFEAGLWNGPFGKTFNVSDVVVAPVSPNSIVPQIMNLFVGYPDYVQLLVELESGIVIVDAPPHRSKLILDWVELNIKGKKITHIVPSHHHRDHAGGVADYLAAGATLVRPEIASDFYQHVNYGEFNVTTYTQEEPFALKDSKIQFSSFWQDANPHARDWSFAVASPICFNATESPNVAILNADVISPQRDKTTAWDADSGRQWLNQVIQLGIPTNATVIGTHGSSEIGLGTQDSLAHLAELMGVLYPEDTDSSRWC